MAPTRIEYVIDHLSVGGAQRHLVELFSGIDRQRFAPQVCVAKPGGALTPVIERMGVPVRNFGLGSSLGQPRTLLALLRMAQRLRTEEVGIVHGYLYLGNILGVLAGRLAGTRVLLASKRSLDRYPRRAQLQATRLANHFAHRILCNADAVHRFVLQEERPHPEKLVVIPNGIRLPVMRPAPVRPPGMSAASRVVGTIGRLNWKKAHGDLLEAARRVCDARADVEFVVVGDGPLRADVERQAARLGIRAHVHFLGEIRDPRALLGGFDIFVLSSVIEGMPNVLLEALAVEKPAVVTRAGGMPEIVTHEETGLLVPPADPDALAASILRLLDRPDEAARLGRAGRRLVETRFSATAMIASLTSLYEQLEVEHGLRPPRPVTSRASEDGMVRRAATGQ